MSKAGPIIAFILGAAAGSITTWQLLKKYYEDKAEKDIQSVKEAYGRHEQKEVPVPMEVNKVKEENPSYVAVTKIIETSGYVPKVPEIPKHDGPYVISPDEFGEYYEYQKVYLMYFADGALADNEYDILTDLEIQQSVGYECLEHFGDYEEDVVHVRNDSKRCDYEITKDFRNYSDLSPADE